MVAGREAYREGPYKFVRYAASTFCLGRQLRRLHDRRRRASIDAAVIGGVAVLGFALQVPSLMELDRWVREGALDKVLGRRRLPLRDCLRDWAMAAEVSSVWVLNDVLLATTRRNKVFQGGTVHGWHGVALDGTELGRTHARCCPACQGYRHADGRMAYVHRRWWCRPSGVGCRWCGACSPIAPRRAKRRRRCGR